MTRTPSLLGDSYIWQGGDQRDRARERNSKKDAPKGNKEELTLNQRKERDAAAMRKKLADAEVLFVFDLNLKVLLHQAKKTGGGGGS
jgi:hypothetical protein